MPSPTEPASPVEVASPFIIAGSKCKRCYPARYPPKLLWSGNILLPAPHATAPRFPLSSEISSVLFASGHMLPVVREAKYKHSS